MANYPTFETVRNRLNGGHNLTSTYQRTLIKEALHELVTAQIDDVDELKEVIALFNIIKSERIKTSDTAELTELITLGKKARQAAKDLTDNPSQPVDPNSVIERGESAILNNDDVKLGDITASETTVANHEVNLGISHGYGAAPPLNARIEEILREMADLNNENLAKANEATAIRTKFGVDAVNEALRRGWSLTYTDGKKANFAQQQGGKQQVLSLDLTTGATI